MKELISFLEKVTGKPFDYERLSKVLYYSNEACRLWNEVLNTAAYKPAPFGFFDACFHMFPIVTLQGTIEAVDYYQALKDEVEERSKAGIYAITNERYKIYYVHIPLWRSCAAAGPWPGAFKVLKKMASIRAVKANSESVSEHYMARTEKLPIIVELNEEVKKELKLLRQKILWGKENIGNVHVLQGVSSYTRVALRGMNGRTVL